MPASTGKGYMSDVVDTGQGEKRRDPQTAHFTQKRNSAYREASARGQPVYLFFSVNESRRFCGVAHMASPVDPRASLPDWSPTETHRWKGSFAVQVGVGCFVVCARKVHECSEAAHTLMMIDC